MTAADSTASGLAITLFGPFSVSVNGAPLPRLRTRKGRWLLALLVLRSGREVERGWLAGTLWPDSDEPQALGSLRKSLADLRAALGSEAARLESPTAHTVRFDLDGAFVDVLAFDAGVARGSPTPRAAGVGRPTTRASLEQAVALYRGPLLEGCGEEWAFQERQAREQAYLTALETLASAALERGEPGAAERYLCLAVAVDPLRESSHRARMQALAAGGNYAAALLAYRELRLLLHRELNTEPDPETTRLFQEIRAEARSKAERVGARVDSVEKGERQMPGVWLSAAGEEAESLLREPLLQTCEQPVTRPSAVRPELLEAVGGAVPLDSAFYVERPVDDEFRAAIARRDSVVLIKGARQMGKTSLLARGLHQARKAGAWVVRTDLQALNATDFGSLDALFLKLADSIADQLGLDVDPEEVWHPRRGPNENFKRYWQRVVLGAADTPIVWGVDEADRLFACDFGSDVFGLFRSWHNDRALDPEGPWRRLSLAIAYATEHHLFITDVNQSPFNVGTLLTLEDFTLDQVADLNQRYGAPLRDDAEVARYAHLVGGQPYLVRRGLYLMVTRGLDLATVEGDAHRDEGIFTDHLRRMLVLLTRDPELCGVVREVLRGRPCPTVESFYRLRSAGVVAGESARDVRPRCRLYADYLERHLL